MLYLARMISQIKGAVIDSRIGRVVVEVGGLGYEVLVPAPLLEHLRIGQTAQLFTYHHIRENAQELYGFNSADAKELFELLLGVSGVGPKSALAVMGLGEHDRIRRAVAGEDIALIASASGVGKRTSERICVELKDKVGVIAGYAFDERDGDDARAALVALGYSPAQAAQALSEIDAKLSTEERVKKALKELA